MSDSQLHPEVWPPPPQLNGGIILDLDPIGLRDQVDGLLQTEELQPDDALSRFLIDFIHQIKQRGGVLKP